MAISLHVALAGGGLFHWLWCTLGLCCLLLLLEVLILLLHCAGKLLSLQVHQMSGHRHFQSVLWALIAEPSCKAGPM